MKPARDEHAAMLAKELNVLAAGIDAMTSLVGLAGMALCLIVGGYLVYTAVPALNALPKDLAPLDAMMAILKIDGFTFGACIMGLGIAVWRTSRPRKN